jgi:hypothetical protein
MKGFVMSSVRFPPPSRALGILFLLGGILVPAGCGSGHPVGEVAGVVTCNGEPVTTGTVNFYAPEKGLGDSAPLDASGKFKFTRPLDVGTYKVYIQPPPPQQLPPGSPLQPMVKLNIPQTYQDAAATPLSKEVKTGKNEFPIDLTQ